ncbi:hypothetical protein FRC07_013691 [Ceratobasidium sp. 392]|nr:hypothetical protein FRC07_013691 [Ceratobasidium sp. 392]
MAPRISLPTSSDEKPRPSLFTPARAGIALILTIILALFTLSPSSAAIPHPPSLKMASPSGWHSRATPHPDGAAYDVRKENVIFGMTRNTRVEPEGFSVALFKPNVAVDAMGRVVKHDRTDYPIDQLYVSTSNGLHTIGVYGHDGETTTLKPPVGDITDLPTPLNSIITLAKEGRNGFERGTQNDEVVSKVKAVLQDE